MPTPPTTNVTPQPDDLTFQEIDNLRRELAEVRASSGAANAQVPELRQANADLDTQNRNLREQVQSIDMQLRDANHHKDQAEAKITILT